MLKCGQSAGKILKIMIKINQIPDEIGFYITGFVDGEGSFNVSFKIRNDYEKKIKITACFNISQKEERILNWIKNILKCGTIRARGDGVFYYEVTNLQTLVEIIIPFFERFPLRTNKFKSFMVFKEIVMMMNNKEHLTPGGFNKILKIAGKRQL